MKKQLVIALALFVGSISFAQKNELKAAEKAIKSTNFADAKSAIQSAEKLISNMDDKAKAKFYFLKGQALYANGSGTDNDINSAIESFESLKDFEATKGKLKYTKTVEEIKVKMLNDFLTKANSALENKDYMLASNRFDNAYKTSPKDTIYLFYAASTAINAKDYDASLAYYLKLKELNYKGEVIRYLATNKETGVEENFDTKVIRDLSITSGSHIAPKDEKSKSKLSEIVKNIALIYVAQGKNQEAIEAMQDARKANPDDTGLLLSEANIHLKMGNKDRFKELIEEATIKDPSNAELQFNLGILAADSGDVVTAKKYYNKAMELNPNYVSANINMAVLLLGSDKDIMEEMNSLGNSSADNKKYDELLEKRKSMYREAIPYLKKAIELDVKNIDAVRTLKNIYSSLGETDKFKEMKAKLEVLESGN